MSTSGYTETPRIANLYFNSMNEMLNAFQSEIGQQCAADREILASNEAVQIYLNNTKKFN